MATENPSVEMSKEEASKHYVSMTHTLEAYNAMHKHADDYRNKLEAISKHLLALEETQPEVFEGVPKETLKPEMAKVIDPTHLVNRLIKQYQEQRELAASAKNSNETLHQSLDEAKHQIEKTQGELREMASKYTESVEKTDKLQEEIEHTKNQMDDLQYKKSKLEDKLQKQSDEFERQRLASQSELEEMTSKYTSSEKKAKRLQEDIEQSTNQMNDLQQLKVKLENELQKQGDEFKKLRQDFDKELESNIVQKRKLEREIDRLEDELRRSDESKNQVTTKLRELHEWIPNTVEYCCEVPESAHTDPRLKGILEEFMRRVNVHMSGHATMDTRAVAGPSIDGRVPVLLPCVKESRIVSDIRAALAKANIVSGARVILLIFHHLAPHNSRIGVPTEQRLSDRSLLDQCVGMVDAVFWNGEMYDCDANQTAVTRVQELFRWSLSLQDLQRLNQIVHI